MLWEAWGKTEAWSCRAPPAGLLKAVALACAPHPCLSLPLSKRECLLGILAPCPPTCARPVPPPACAWGPRVLTPPLPWLLSI